MVEVTFTCDFLPGADMRAYERLVKQGTQQMLKARGIVEMRAYRNLLGSPQVRANYVFQTMSEFAAFWESPDMQNLFSQMRQFITNPQVEVWGPSPVLPEPLRPGK